MKTTLCIFFLALSQFIPAAEYYVDGVGGLDTNPGTEAQPWRKCPGMSSSEVTQTINSGDTIRFKKSTIHPMDSAIAPRAGVTYSTYGTGTRPILQGGYTTIRCFDFRNGADNVTVDGLEIQDFGSYPADDIIYSSRATIASVDTVTNTVTTTADHTMLVNDQIAFTLAAGGSWFAPVSTETTGLDKKEYYIASVPTSSSFTLKQKVGTAYNAVDITGAGSGATTVWKAYGGDYGPRSGIAFDLTGINDNIAINDCVITRIGQWRNIKPMWGVNGVTGDGIKMENCNGVTITNCDISRVSVGIAIKSSAVNGPIENITIDGCRIHDSLKWGIDIAPYATGAVIRNIDIKNTHIYDYHEFDLGNWTGFGERPHTDGIFLRSIAVVATWDNLRIHGCDFYVDNPGASQGGTGAIYISQGPSVLIYNNIFRSPRHGRGIYINTDLGFNQTVRIYNNTFVNCNKIDINASNDGIYHANNIYYYSTSSSSTQIIYHYTSGTAVSMVQFDNDLFYNPQIGETTWTPFTINANPSGGKYRTFANLQANGWQLNGDYGNPLFVDIAGPYAETNFRIEPTSAAANLGTNLSAFFTDDKDGNTRAASGPWDAGAYISGATAPSDTTAPTITSATLGASGETITLTFSEAVTGIDLAHYAIAGHTPDDLSGSGSTRTFNISPIRQAGPDFTCTYTAGTTEDLAGNNLATVTFTIINGSLESTPNPPTPGSARAARKRLSPR